MSTIENVVPALRQALEQRGYSALTEVQRAVTDFDLGEQDALVSAQTGSGKTVAFGLAMAPSILDENDAFESRDVSALVVAPTRELALQVKRELVWLYAKTGAQIASCVGGMDPRTERRALERGANIVVGTPGRLVDHMRRGALDASSLQVVVLDEADEMLDLGFKDDLEFILEQAPRDRRTLMFSATVSKSIAALAKNYQNDAVRISTKEESKQHSDIEYRAFSVMWGEQQNAIINILRFYEAQNALVFCNTRAAVNNMMARLHNRGFSVVALSGELSQSERMHALQALRDGRARVCVATDVAARGIDLPNLELVIHAELPTNSETLLHRSGRTGRAGRKGVSALIVPSKSYKKAERLLHMGKIKADWSKPPSLDDVLARDNERLMNDPIFESESSEADLELGADLLDRYGAEKIAAAYVKQVRQGQSAPEELADFAPEDLTKGRRGERGDRRERGGREPRESARNRDFGPSVWYSLSVGRKQRAEPRWLIPVVCEGGNISKKDIGSIKIQPTETLVEISESMATAFDEALGPNPQLDKNIRVKRLAGRPKFERDEGDDGNHSAPRRKKAKGRFEGEDGGAEDFAARNSEIDRELEALFGGVDIGGAGEGRGRGRQGGRPKSGPKSGKSFGKGSKPRTKGKPGGRAKPGGKKPRAGKSSR